MAEPLALVVPRSGLNRLTLSGSAERQLALMAGQPEPIQLAIPKGVSEVILQARMCGDYYAECSKGKAIRSAYAGDPEAALSLAFDAIRAAA